MLCTAMPLNGCQFGLRRISWRKEERKKSAATCHPESYLNVEDEIWRDISSLGERSKKGIDRALVSLKTEWDCVKTR
jgi:hypothetical protein